MERLVEDGACNVIAANVLTEPITAFIARDAQSQILYPLGRRNRIMRTEFVRLARRDRHNLLIDEPTWASTRRYDLGNLAWA